MCKVKKLTTEQRMKYLEVLVHKEALNFLELCIFVGFSESTAYKLTASKKIPHTEVGRLKFFKRTEIEQWLLSNPVKTVADMESEADSFLNSKKKGRNRL